MIINKEKLDHCNKKIIDFVELLENKYGTVIINSGYRNQETNKLVGGSKNSYHLLGQAVDISIKDVSCIKVAAFVLENCFYINGIGLDVFKNYCHFDMREQDHKTYWVYGREGKYI